MSTNGRPPGGFTDDADGWSRQTGAVHRDDHRTALEEHDELVQRAIEFEAEHGFWPPDPPLDEVAEMRRQVLAEHDNDYRKVLEHYVELGRQRSGINGHPRQPPAQNGAACVSGP